MSGNPKFSILEQNGIELSYPLEYTPEAIDILYEIGAPGNIKEYLDYPLNALMPRTFLGDFTIPSDWVLPMHSVSFTNELKVDGEIYIL